MPIPNSIETHAVRFDSLQHSGLNALTVGKNSTPNYAHSGALDYDSRGACGSLTFILTGPATVSGGNPLDDLSVS